MITYQLLFKNIISPNRFSEKQYFTEIINTINVVIQNVRQFQSIFNISYYFYISFYDYRDEILFALLKFQILSDSNIIFIINQLYMQKSISDKENPKNRRNIKLEQRSESVTNVTHTSFRHHKSKNSFLNKHLNIQYFKQIPCNKTQIHNHKNCMNYHNAKDRKRPGNFYSAQLCKYIQQNKKCPQGDQCINSHSRVEQLYRNDTYKTKFCSHYPNNIPLCQYGQFCSFAHAQSEIIIELIHNLQFDDDFYMFYYKTVFCPFNLTEHDKALCVYAHNWQDFRRKPSYYFYEPIACMNWKLKVFVSDYQNDGCQNYFNCNMCHGWKQLQYHPLNYRTKKCPSNSCKKGQCHYYHTQKQKRIIQEEFYNKIFRMVPRNRIVEGTFKHDYTTGFTAKRQEQINHNQKQYKENTVILLKNGEFNDDNRKFKTTINLNEKKSTGLLLEDNKWIPEGTLYESDEQDHNDHVKKVIQLIQSQ